MPYKALDFFAGAGGLSEGLRMAGIQVIYANEIDKWAKMTYEYNHKGTIFHCGDISKLTVNSINSALQKKFGISVENVDIMAGGPPCQGFSIIGQRNIDDPRNRLFREFLKLVKKIKPKIFIMENVFGLLSIQNGKVKDEIIEAFSKAGYTMSEPKVLSSCDFGVPQIRKRVFFFGIREDLSSTPLVYPLPTHKEISNNNSTKLVTVKDAISDLPEEIIESSCIDVGEAVPYSHTPSNDYQSLMRCNCKFVYNHHTKRLLETRMERISKLSEGATKESLPKELQAGGHENKYRRLSFNEPSPTLTAHMSKDLSDFIHPKYNRPITVREAARIQSFSDNYIFLGSEYQQLKQIGNAVPPLLAKAIGDCIVEQLKSI
jgi:DNA (cytosine-5)-methyltransferase 1